MNRENKIEVFKKVTFVVVVVVVLAFVVSILALVNNVRSQNGEDSAQEENVKESENKKDTVEAYKKEDNKIEETEEIIEESVEINVVPEVKTEEAEEANIKTDNATYEFQGSNPEALSTDNTAYVSSRVRNEDTDGGSSTIRHSVVIKGSSMTMYRTTDDTTGDSGFTEKAVTEVSEQEIDSVKELIGKANWVDLFTYTEDKFSNCEPEVVSYGVTDEESKNENGDYLWKLEFVEEVYSD